MTIVHVMELHGIGPAWEVEEEEGSGGCHDCVVELLPCAERDRNVNACMSFISQTDNLGEPPGHAEHVQKSSKGSREFIYI